MDFTHYIVVTTDIFLRIHITPELPFPRTYCGNWRDGFMVKNMYCSCRGPEFRFQYKFPVANSCL